MNKTEQLISQNALQTRIFGRKLGENLGPGDVVAITGPLGVGKTVFAQGIGDSFGIDYDITSPTFTIMNEHSGSLDLYHLDLYRLNSSDEFAWLGLEEVLNGMGVSVIEWGERAGKELPERTFRVKIEFIDKDQRSITVSRDGNK